MPYARDAAELMGANVRTTRLNRHWTAAEFGAHAGCSRHTVAAIERGRPSVAFGHVLNVCAALGIPLGRSGTASDTEQLWFADSIPSLTANA
ncbi:MAG: helix-turn-helix transcriptional regulator [Micropruina sp.]|uniref:helix-turn-helix transcriptional regulator n=1 Tax=Micropruina sp. TaxID=2737536 RepID=UPI0039E356CC